MLHSIKLLSLIIPISIILSSCKKENKTVEYLGIDAITTNNLIKEVIDEINNNYADEVTREKLEEGAINGMLAFLDEHSMYISQDEFDAFNKSARGAFMGVGIEIKQVKEGIEVSSVIDDSPAAISGLKPSDIITKINDKDTNAMPIKEVISKLSSDTALKVQLSIVRNKTEKFDVSLKKSVIQLPSVKIDFVSDIALIKISYFNELTSQEITNAIKQVLSKKSVGLILDLRNNPGGILDQAISVCNLFLNKGKIVAFKSRHIDDSKSIYATGTELLPGIPIAVLIDRTTASGAEIVAAALGENKRAIIIGEKSYGKGSLQSIIPIPGRGAIKLTTSYLLTPNNFPINQVGITPDIEIPVRKTQEDDKNDAVVLRAMDLLHGLTALYKTKK